VRVKRVLVIDGNTAAIRARQREMVGYATGEGYTRTLRSLDEHLSIDIVTPADGAAELPAGTDLSAYDGVAVTGSALNVYDGGPAVERQIAIVQEAFAARKPLFGSCWGLQIAVAAAGGEIVPNPRGREFGFGRRIQLTPAGKSHPMYAGKPEVFEAPTVHLDAVARLPVGATVLAENDHGIQAVVGARDTFWAVQYHPEYDFLDIAAAAERYAGTLIREGIFSDGAAVAAYTSDMRALQANPREKSLLWRYGLGTAVADRRIRSLELRNWLSSLA